MERETSRSVVWKVRRGVAIVSDGPVSLAFGSACVDLSVICS